MAISAWIALLAIPLTAALISVVVSLWPVWIAYSDQSFKRSIFGKIVFLLYKNMAMEIPGSLQKPQKSPVAAKLYVLTKYLWILLSKTIHWSSPI